MLVINEAESGNHEPSSEERNGADPAERGRNKKQVVLQMLILQLASALRWQLKEIDEAVNLAMQHTLLDILLQSTGKVGMLGFNSLLKGFPFNYTLFSKE